MKSKSFLPIIFTLLITLIAGTSFCKDTPAENVSGEQTLNQEANHASRIIVYYFHGNFRCHTCRQIEALTKDAMKEYKAVYLAAIGGAGALIAKSIKKSEVVAYEELGAEAIRRLEVEDFPVTVVNDIYGGDLYQEGKARYRID